MTLVRFLWTGAGVLSLFGVVRAFPAAPCWALFPLLALVSWPLWRQRAEAALLTRRALLAGLTRDESRVRSWLWGGHVASVWHAVSAFVWALVLVALASVFEPWHWAVVAADVALLALAGRWIEARLAGEVRPEALGWVSRRWPLLVGNALLLTIALVACDFFLGSVDTRGLAWHEVAERALSNTMAGAACPFAGIATGMAAALDQLSWHAAQVLIPGLPNVGLRIAAWLAVLLQAGAAAWAITRLLVGMAGLARERGAGARTLSAAPPSKVFLTTLVTLALVYGLALWSLQDFDTRSWGARAARTAEAFNPCRPDAQSTANVRAALEGELRAAHAAALAASDARADAAVRAAFAGMELGVDRYLDWYFTVLAEYQRLGAWVAGDFAGLLRRELETHVFGGPGAFAARVEALDGALEQETQKSMTVLARNVQGRIREGLAAQPCRFEGVDLKVLAHFERDAARAGIALGTGVAAGLAVRALAARAAASVASRLAAKRAFQVAGRLGGNVAAKRAGSITLSAAGAAAACAPGGPLAALCALGAGVVAWLAVDQAMVRIDEALFRDEMRAELLAALNAEQLEVAAAIKARHRAAIDAAAGQLQAGMERMFVPARHGL